MMEKGDKVVLTEPVVSAGLFGAEYLLKDTVGTFLHEQGMLADIEILSEIYTVPLKSIAKAMDLAA